MPWGRLTHSLVDEGGEIVSCFVHELPEAPWPSRRCLERHRGPGGGRERQSHDGSVEVRGRVVVDPDPLRVVAQIRGVYIFVVEGLRTADLWPESGGWPVCESRIGCWGDTIAALAAPVRNPRVAEAVRLTVKGTPGEDGVAAGLEGCGQ